MRIHFRLRHGIAALLVAALLFTPGLRRAGSHALWAQDTCAVTANCGMNCTAKLVSGYCIRLAEVHWRGGLPTPLGTLKIGPEISAECWLCECAYTFTDANGNARFSRISDLKCSASVGGATTTQTVAE